MNRAALYVGLAMIVAGVWWELRPAGVHRRDSPAWLPPPVPMEALPSRWSAAPAVFRPVAAAPAVALGEVRPMLSDAPNAAPITTTPSAPAVDKLAVLEEILRTHDDNDPRLDRAFNDLSIAQKRQFRKKYAEIAPERRNDLGTIVFLLGKNLRTDEDWEFLRRVVEEPTCLSLSDCSRPPAHAEDESDVEITLAYPQMVALAQAERVAKGRGAAVREALSVLRSAQSSQSDLVARKASQILNGL